MPAATAPSAGVAIQKFSYKNNVYTAQTCLQNTVPRALFLAEHRSWPLGAQKLGAQHVAWSSLDGSWAPRGLLG